MNSSTFSITVMWQFDQTAPHRNDADADGIYFIDRDPTLFEVILQYLRTGRPSLFFGSTTQTHDLAE
ncbi:hypothetical protein GGI42DRAFT_337450 [Trichoderma sp. SZMC 28013]